MGKNKGNIAYFPLMYLAYEQSQQAIGFSHFIRFCAIL